jgi:deoxyribodipyrimidine photo-lyase
LKRDLHDKLYCFQGSDTEVLSKILLQHNIGYIAFNKDYTPYAKKRDESLISWCASKRIPVIAEEDYTLYPLNFIKTDKGDPYSVFTPFYRKCLANVNEIQMGNVNPKYTPYNAHHLNSIKNIDQFYFNEPNYNLCVQGGRERALDILNKRIAKGEFTNYDKFRDYPFLNKTTRLSAYIKFGCVSIREVFDAIRKRHGIHHGLIRELFWREFYANITHNFPRVLAGQENVMSDNHAFKPKYDAIRWTYDNQYWEAFVNGKTGYPMVDAGIRQLKTTGWCHNRSRMIIAMFAAKDLHIAPNIVEKWFANNLVDYDPSSNSGGVQWAYGIGSDAQPYFRIFNPITQGLKFDKDAKYILQYVPELKTVPKEDIHTWHTSWSKHQHINYPKPIVDHAQQAKKIKELFSAIH